MPDCRRRGSGGSRSTAPLEADSRTFGEPMSTRQVADTASGLRSTRAKAQDAGRNTMLLADREQAMPIDQVQQLAVSETLATWTIAGGSDHDAQGRSLMLHPAEQVANVRRLDGLGHQPPLAAVL